LKPVNLSSPEQKVNKPKLNKTVLLQTFFDLPPRSMVIGDSTFQCCFYHVPTCDPFGSMLFVINAECGVYLPIQTYGIKVLNSDPTTGNKNPLTGGVQLEHGSVFV